MKPPLHASAPRPGLQRLRSSLKRSSAAVSGPKPYSDISTRKKVKFDHSSDVAEQSCKEVARLCSKERSHSPTCSDAKTLEYVSFRKLREETCQRPDYHRTKSQDKKLRKSVGRECTQQFSHSSFKDNMINHLTHIENGETPPQRLSHSPLAFTLDKSQPFHYLKSSDVITPSYRRNRMLSSMQAISPFVQRSFCSPASASQKLGAKGMEQDHQEDLTRKTSPIRECNHGGIFSRKRESLLYLAAEALSLEVKEFALHRSKVIPKFLDRLGKGKKTPYFADVARKKSIKTYPLHSSSKSHSESTDETFETELEKFSAQRKLENKFSAHNIEEEYDLNPSSSYLSKSLALKSCCDYERQILTSYKSNRHFDDSLVISKCQLFLPNPEKHVGKENITYISKKANVFGVSEWGCVGAVDFTSLSPSDTGFHCMERPSGRMSAKLSKQHLEYKVGDNSELIAKPESRRYGLWEESESIHCSLSNSDPDGSSSGIISVEQALVPYVNSGPFKKYDFPDVLDSPVQQCVLPLLGWRNEKYDFPDVLDSPGQRCIPPLLGWRNEKYDFPDVLDSPLQQSNLPLLEWRGENIDKRPTITIDPFESVSSVRMNDSADHVKGYTCSTLYCNSRYPNGGSLMINEWNGCHDNEVLPSSPSFELERKTSSASFRSTFSMQFDAGLQLKQDKILDI